MERQRFCSGVTGALIAAAMLVATPAGAQDNDAGVTPVTGTVPAIVLAHLSTDPRQPDGYSAHLELRVKMRTFPYIGLTVHGTSSYRKPGLYHFELQNLPRIAGKFDDLRYDLGDPTSWGARYEIAMAPGSTDDAPVLRLTPRKPGLVTYLDIEADAHDAHMLKATWKRRDGGSIVLTQDYTPVGSIDVVTQQHASIDIPHFRAELTATYSGVTLDTSTFASVPER